MIKRFFLMGMMVMTASAGAEELAFKSHGKPHKHLELENIEGLVPAQKVSAIEPHESVQSEYMGFSANALFTKVYGDKWKEAEEILFTCVDGYQPSIPVSQFLKHKAYLVFKRIGSERFMVQNKMQANEVVPLGPFYLIWDNKSDEFIKAKGASGWPYQVTTIDLIKFADRFPKIAPPLHSSAAVNAGFAHFRDFCMSCHKINGQGGDKSIDLNSPVSVTTYRDEAWLKRWISNPPSVRPGTKMPALNTALQHRDEVIAEIVAYLKAMASAKPKH